MDEATRRIVRRASVISAGLGFALAPLPGVDDAALLPVHLGMFVAVARARGRGVGELPWFALARATVAATSVRAVARLTFRRIPRAARLSNALTAVALTRFLGWYYDRACEHPAAAPGVSLRELWRDFTTADAAPVG